MANIILTAVILLIVGSAAAYIRKEKKRGVKCVGCPDAMVCAGKCSGCSGNCGKCAGHTEMN